MGKVPKGTDYETWEGERAGSAVRKAKCQVVSDGGGSVLSIPRLVASGRAVATFSGGATPTSSEAGKAIRNDGCSA